jgi:hypothetical protein
MYHNFLYCLIIIASIWSCSKHSKTQISESAVKQDCYKDRKKEDDIIKKRGVIEKIADHFMIATEDNRYMPCEIPKPFNIEGTKVIFSGETRAVYPHERWAGLPFHLAFIDLEKQ